MSELIQSDKPATAEYWARRISHELCKSVESIISAGAELLDAKAACEHGEFCRMFSDHDSPIENHLSISRKTAFCLMSIAECLPLLNVQHARHLPTSWTTLYELSRLPEMDLQDAIESGRVTPELKRGDVRKLIAGDEEKTPPLPLSKKARQDDLIADTRTAIRDLADEFGDDGSAAVAVVTQELESLSEEVAAVKPHVTKNSGDNEWYTPELYITAARRAMGGIDLDPASSAAANAVVKAEKFYTAEDDGLSQEWSGRVWLNPPYAQPLVYQFCDRLVNHIADGRVTTAIALVNNATETKWFQLLMDRAQAVCFLFGRIKFWKHGDTERAVGLQGQAVIYFGADVQRFRTEFSPLGRVAMLGTETGGSGEDDNNCCQTTTPVRKHLPEMVAAYGRSKSQADDLRVLFERLSSPHKTLLREWLAVEGEQ